MGEQDRSAARTYGWVAAAVFGVIAVVAGLGTLLDRDETPAIAELTGRPLAQFAVPSVRGSRVGDANVAQDDCATGELPCREPRVPACEVPGPQIIRVCDLFDRPLVLSFWFTRGAQCESAQDAVDRVGRRHRGRLNVLSVNVGGDRREVRAIVRRRGWRMPVGWDRDGAASTLYGVAVCPLILYALPGGLAHQVRVGREAVRDTERDAARLLARARRLERAGR